jgi:hypothetical protein
VNQKTARSPRAGGNRQFATALGEMVVAWNQVEQQMKMFIAFYGDDPLLFVTAAEMGVSAYTSALTVIAREVVQADVGQSLKVCLSSANTLREHRNYLVHGTITTLGLSWPSTEPPQAWSDGLVQFMAAKSTYVQIREQVHPSYVDELTEQMRELRTALSNTLAVARWDKTPSGERPPLHPLQVQPEKLQKSVQQVQWLSQQPS